MCVNVCERERVCVCGVCVCEREREICVEGFGMVAYWCIEQLLNNYSYLHNE